MTEYATDTALADKVDPTQLSDTIRCESRGNTTAIGDHGLAYGIAQWHKDSFNWIKSLAISKGAPFQDFKYEDPKAQIQLMSWAFAHGLASQWSCYTKLFK